MTKHSILVGDKFGTFATNDHVTTPLAFAAALEDGRTRSCNLIRGQGVSDSWMSHILEIAERVGAKITLVGDGNSVNRASSRSCHKIKRQNVLISEPRLLRSDVFGAQLLIDEDCELMGDHQTGHHLQGMLLIEAARQMFLAVIERFLRSGRGNYAVINHMNVGFSAFAFPLETSVELTVKSRKEDRPDRASYDVEVAFLQNGETVTVVDTRFTVFDAAALAPKEAAMAVECIESSIDTASCAVALAS